MEYVCYIYNSPKLLSPNSIVFILFSIQRKELRIALDFRF